MSLAESLSVLGPFGQGFPAADIRLTFQPASASIKLMSRKEEAGELEKGQIPEPVDYKHLKVVTGHGLELLWWNKADQYELLSGATLVTAVIELSTNLFMGNARPQAFISSLVVHTQRTPRDAA